MALHLLPLSTPWVGNNQQIFTSAPSYLKCVAEKKKKRLCTGQTLHDITEKNEQLDLEVNFKWQLVHKCCLLIAMCS